MPAQSESSIEANRVLILTGPPGVGKTTTARMLAARVDRAVHLEADAFFRFIAGGQVDPWRPESHAQNQVVMRVVARAAAGYAEAGYFTIVDGIVIPGWFLEPIRDALFEAGHSAAYAVLRAPFETCLGRVQSREGKPSIDADAIRQLWRSFTDLGHLEQNVLEVDGLRPEEISELLTQRLADETLGV